jgi:predicted NAD/FAD-binding protein
MPVAIIGTGIAGNAAAWALSKRYPVTVLRPMPRLRFILAMSCMRG